MTIFFKRTKLLALGSIFLFLAGIASAGTVLFGGIEDTAGMSGFEGKGDFNDMIFKMSGDISLLAPGSSFASLNSSMVTESGNIFWDRPSIDGAKYNLGYCLLGGGNCVIPNLQTVPLEYLATQTGDAPLSVLFQATGPVTFDLIFEKTALDQTNVMGWFDPANPGVLHQIFSGPNGAGVSISFIPTPTFGLYFTNAMGQFFSTVAAGNINESTTQEHFAFLNDSPLTTPEPATIGISGLALALLGWQKTRVRRKQPSV